MFTEIVKPKRRGRPPGQTAQGAATRERLYATAVRMIGRRGYDATTLRDIADEAGVSAGLLYRYFPSKEAVLVALYDELSLDFERRTAQLPPGRWRDRFGFALGASLASLQPHRPTLRALIPVLVNDGENSVFGAATAFSRVRVAKRFDAAVRDARDAPPPALAAALGRLLYLAHLGAILWWLLDKSPGQRATAALLRLAASILPAGAAALRLPPLRRFVVDFDAIVADALFDDAA